MCIYDNYELLLNEQVLMCHMIISQNKHTEEQFKTAIRLTSAFRKVEFQLGITDETSISRRPVTPCLITLHL